jgi:hypothetical protein
MLYICYLSKTIKIAWVCPILFLSGSGQFFSCLAQKLQLGNTKKTRRREQRLKDPEEE